MNNIFAIANQKGGVGKTTTAVNLATALAACKLKILLIDFDAQGNASTGLGFPPEARERTTYDLILNDTSAVDIIQRTVVPNLSIMPSSSDLYGAELELIEQQGREYKLKNAIAQITADYDYIFIDCPPALGLLTVNALAAASAILVPMQCEFYALEGLSAIIKTLNSIRQSFNPSLKLDGLILTMHDGRNNLTSSVEIDVREYLDDKVFETVIPRNIRLSEAPSHGLPAILYDIKCRGSQAYIALAREFLIRQKANIKPVNHKSNHATESHTPPRPFMGKPQLIRSNLPFKIL